MKETKTKTLQAKVTEQFYEKLSERAISEGESLSSSVNYHLFESFKECIDDGVEISNTSSIINTKEEEVIHENIATSNVVDNPFEHEDFLKLIIWLYSKNRTVFFSNVSATFEEVDYYFAILNKYIVKLDIELIKLFSKIHADLKRAREKHISNPQENIFLSFTDIFSSNNFDFSLFEKIILNKKM